MSLGLKSVDEPSSDLAMSAVSNPNRHHVLYLIDALVGTSGGAEGAIQKLCSFLPADRFQCSVATFSARSDIQEQFTCPVNVYPLQRIYGWDAIKHALTFSRFLREQHVDIVHTFFPASDIWGGLVAKLSGCPILVSSRRDMGIVRLKKHKIPYLFANRYFDQVQAVSDKVREFCLREEGLHPDKVVTVTNGVDLDAIDNAPTYDRSQTLGMSKSAPLVMTVANLRSVKGIDVMLRAVAMLKTEFPDAVFAVVGDANDQRYQEEMFALTAELGIAANVKFLGPRSDVFSLLKMADVFCLPSRSEGLSNALLEAMGCGLPSVATDVGGTPEVIADGKSGFLVPSERPELLAERLLPLLRDAELRRRIGQCGRQIIQQKFTVQHMVGKLALLYEQLLQQRGLSSGRWVAERGAAKSTHDGPNKNITAQEHALL